MEYQMNFLPYASGRYPLAARHGMCNSTSALASEAGLEMLRRGGNAVDAAIATAAALTVVEPTSNGIGSDAFAIVWMNNHLYGLNGSGRAPKNISIDKVLKNNAENGHMPSVGWTPVMVSGAPKTWAALSARFGRLPLTEVLKPAVEYARNGYPVPPVVAENWKRSVLRFEKALPKHPELQEWFRTFAPDGKAPEAGELVTLPNHADTLEKIAATGADAFYRGELAERIVADSKAAGGYMSREDYEDYDVEWVEPLRLNYRGYEVCEIPPNGQGIVALMALNILKEFEFPEKESVETYHRQFEAMKLAFADGLRYITDPACMEVTAAGLLDPDYGKMRARLIGTEARMPEAGIPPKSGTVYFCTADGEGNMVSMIQSNYMGFGSGIVVKDTGISLQNRGYDFSLDPNAANALMPGKRSYHTIIPGFLMKDGKAVGPFGVMGGYMQPQGHVQVVMNLVDFHLNPQQALDAPRWQWTGGMKFLLEDQFSAQIARQLQAKGHDAELTLQYGQFGRGQIIQRLDNGVLIGGTEKRADSNIACW